MPMEANSDRTYCQLAQGSVSLGMGVGIEKEKRRTLCWSCGIYTVKHWGMNEQVKSVGELHERRKFIRIGDSNTERSKCAASRTLCCNSDGLKPKATTSWSNLPVVFYLKPPLIFSLMPSCTYKHRVLANQFSTWPILSTNGEVLFGPHIGGQRARTSPRVIQQH